MSRKINIVIVCLFLPLLGLGQIRKYSNEFLNIGVGAAGLAQGSAVVANTYDVTSGYWNPASLAYMTGDLQMSVMRNQYFAGIANMDYAGFSKPLTDDGSYIGLSYIRLGVDNIPNTINLVNPDGSIQYDSIRNFSVRDRAFLFTYARKSNVDGWTFGGNFKLIRRNVGSFANAWGFGLDFGAHYKAEKYAFAAVVKDVTTTFNIWSFGFTQEEIDILVATGNEVSTGSSLELTAPSIILGGNYKFTIKSDYHIQPELDLKIGTDGKRNVLANLGFLSLDPSLGLQLAYKDIVYVWGGLNNYQTYKDVNGIAVRTIQPNLGAALRIKSIKFQYALANIGSASDVFYSNIFSAVIDINKKSL